MPEERDARRPAGKIDDKGDTARAALRTAAPLALADLAINEEFALVLTRRGADGVHQPVAVVTDEKMLERAIRRSAA